MNATAVRTIATSSVVILGLSLGGAQHAESQTRSRTIGPAVFGGTGTRADRPGGLDLYGQLFVSYDDDVLADQGAGGPDRPGSASPAEERGGLYSGLWAGSPVCSRGREHRRAHRDEQRAQLLSRPRESDDELPSGRCDICPAVWQPISDPREPFRCVFATLFDATVPGAAPARSRPHGLFGWCRAGGT